MTYVQIAALETARNILVEHFDGAVIVAMAETDDQNDEVKAVYHGGYFNAIGLLQTGIDDIKRNRFEPPKE